MGGGSPGGVATLLVALALVVTSTAAAARIVGTDRADVLRGTTESDRIVGGKGDDRLFGLAGNDTLVGGPGFDRFSCGGGRDVAVAERGEPVTKDCEVVERRAPSPTPPPHPAPAAPTLLAGTYCGYTQPGPGICMDTNAAGQVVDELSTGAIVDCSNGVRLTIGFGLQGGDRASIRPDLSFSYAYAGPLSGGSSGVTDIQATYRINGRFTTSGDASGTVAISSLSFTYGGEAYTCTQDEVAWTAKRQ